MTRLLTEWNWLVWGYLWRLLHGAVSHYRYPRTTPRDSASALVATRMPSGALVQTLRITSAGVRGPEVGPLYYNMTKAATLIDLTFFTPGTFLISIGCAATSYSSELVLGGATLNSRTLTATGAGLSGSFNVTVTKPLDGLRIQGTGFGDCMTFAVRARVANSVTV